MFQHHALETWFTPQANYRFVDGVLMATGLLGKDVDEETAAKCAAQCAVNAIAAIKSLNWRPR
jgi:hypothetical protein